MELKNILLHIIFIYFCVSKYINGVPSDLQNVQFCINKLKLLNTTVEKNCVQKCIWSQYGVLSENGKLHLELPIFQSYFLKHVHEDTLSFKKFHICVRNSIKNLVLEECSDVEIINGCLQSVKYQNTTLRSNLRRKNLIIHQPSKRSMVTLYAKKENRTIFNVAKTVLVNPILHPIKSLKGISNFAEKILNPGVTVTQIQSSITNNVMQGVSNSAKDMASNIIATLFMSPAVNEIIKKLTIFGEELSEIFKEATYSVGNAVDYLPDLVDSIAVITNFITTSLPEIQDDLNINAHVLFEKISSITPDMSTSRFKKSVGNEQVKIQAELEPIIDLILALEDFPISSLDELTELLKTHITDLVIRVVENVRSPVANNIKIMINDVFKGVANSGDLVPILDDIGNKVIEKLEKATNNVFVGVIHGIDKAISKMLDDITTAAFDIVPPFIISFNGVTDHASVKVYELLDDTKILMDYGQKMLPSLTKAAANYSDIMADRIVQKLREVVICDNNKNNVQFTIK